MKDDRNNRRPGPRPPQRRIDKPFRRNVAVLIRVGDKFLACQTARHPNWQCVQGGFDVSDASPEAALYRELEEELGTKPEHFKIIHRSTYWRRYRFPREFLVRGKHGGQEQLWYLAELSSMSEINLAASCGEFNDTKLVAIEELLEIYAKWKRAPFLDFCYELGLIKAP